MDKRAFNDSMIGILADTSTTSFTVGMTRTLTYNFNVLTNRGYLKPYDGNSSDIDIGNAFSIAEAAVPLVANHDSAMRVNMLVAQTKQSIPIKETNKPLIVNGYESAISHTLGSDFVFRAKNDGKVIEFNEKANLMIIEYKDGSKDTIDLNFKPAKNGGGGFYIMNNLTTKLKKGDSFKKNDILAKNDKFFKEDDEDDKSVDFTMSKLAWVAAYSGDFTHEDSSLIRESLCESLSTEITMKKDRILGKNSNIDFIVKKGASIKTGDPLLIFEQSYEEEEINQILSKIADELDEEITKLSKNQLVSKYTGRIDDIKIYYTCEIDEMSPSLQKIVKSYNSTIVTKEKLLNKYYNNINDSNIILDPHEKINATYNKVKGNEMPDSVMIEFYITYKDKMNVGDKISYNTALKSIISKVVSDDECPYTEHRNQKIDCLMSYISISKRMTTSIFLTMYCNKVLLELKEHIREIWEGKDK